MRKISLGCVWILVIGCLVLAGCPDNSGKTPPPEPGLQVPQPTKVVPVRIGYANSMIINAHIGIALTHSNILENNLLKGEIKDYDSDTLLLEDFNKGLLDVAFTVDFPGLKALGKVSNGLMLASFGSLGMVALVVRSDTPVQNIKELKGTKVGVPSDSNAHLYLLSLLKEKRLVVDKDVTVIKMEPASLKSALDNKTIAGAVFSDPKFRQYELTGVPYNRIADSRFRSLALLNRNFYNKNQGHAKHLLTALKTACYYLATHQVELNNMVIKTGKIPRNIVPNLSSLNHNYMAGSADRINISIKNLLPNWNKIIQYLYEQKLIEKPFNLSEVTISELQGEIERKLTPAESDLGKIKFTSPSGQ